MWRRLWAYLGKKEAWAFLGVVLAGIALVYGLFFVLLLPRFTRQGEEYVLPSLTGRSYASVQRALESAGFVVSVIDSQYVPDADPNTVLLQDPPPKTRIKKGRKVYLTLASHTPPQLPLPHVQDLPYEQAYRLLRESYGFRVGEVEYVAGDIPDIVKGVRYQGRLLKPGEPVPKYATLSLIVSRGLSDQKVSFISVVGLPLEEAVSRLSAAGLSVGYIRYKPSPQAPPGHVYRQYPERVPGDSLPMGMAIDLFVNGEAPQSVSE